ncbi:LAME_0F05842g1_1 [Lachancea meyersii CBS 8951]|uniref:LAME_0F05842g1_1 n=1 Tax=Lachancea meyersii CBS 8951 TaxID=1266667 RepID=A0A1G4JT10_9SACH|nr:LAME_0F05842g1_1 [Lachancea meyersii CBS 8951]
MEMNQLRKDSDEDSTTDPAVVGISEVTNVGQIAKIDPDVSGEELEPGLRFYHQEVLAQELSLIRDLKTAQLQITGAINELMREMDYKSADDDKKYKFKWSTVSTYNLLKYCYDIGPFYGFENGKDPSLRKLEQSSFISLKWGCVWYDVLRSADYSSQIVPTELQCKTRFKYLLEQAHSRLFIGDIKKQFILTGVPRVDAILEKVTKLKYEAEERKTVLQKFEGQRAKRSVSDMIGDTIDSGLASVEPELADLSRIGADAINPLKRRVDIAAAARLANEDFRDKQLALQQEQLAVEHERLALSRQKEAREATDSNVKRVTSILGILGYAHDLDNERLRIKDTLLHVLQNALHDLQTSPH